MKFIPHTAYATLLPPANEVWGKVIFLHLFVILFTGEYLTHTPRDQVHPPGPGTPPRPGTPPGTRYPLGPGTPPWDQVHPLRPGTPPGTRYTPWDQVHPRTRYTVPRIRYTPQDQVHPPGAEHAGRYGQHTGGMHPTGMQSCFLNN